MIGPGYGQDQVYDRAVYTGGCTCPVLYTRPLHDQPLMVTTAVVHWHITLLAARPGMTRTSVLV